MLSTNTCEGVHLIVKLLAISLKACKFTKNVLLHTLSRILARFKLLFIVFFLGIVLWNDASRFNEGVCFSDGEGFIFKWGMHTMAGTSVLIEGFTKKIVG